jgi:uncharacterized membrane protein YraQ (UPF0718 family)
MNKTKKQQAQSKERSWKKASVQALRGLWAAAPILVGVILLLSLLPSLMKRLDVSFLFGSNGFINLLIGAVIGSVSAGNSLTSYILGGELLDNGVGLIAVTALIVSWVTVGIVQLPAESMILGKKFAVWRNVLSFVFSIIVAVATVALLGVIQ